MIEFLKNELIEKNKELKEWRGLLPEYKAKVNRLIEVETYLASLPAPDPKNYPPPPKKTEEALPEETVEEEEGGSEELNQPTFLPEDEPEKLSQIEQ